MSTIAPRLDLRQSQNLVMTPQLQQAIKLLQLNNVELAEYVESELAQNPLLERADAEGAKAEDSAEAAPSEGSGSDDAVREEFDQAWTGNEADTAAPAAAPADFDAGSSMANMGAGGQSNFENPETSFENTVSREETLRDHLLGQLHVAFDDPRDLLIGAQLIDMLDESGYLRAPPEELAARLACPPERLNRVLDQARQFDPTGIFARDLKDCLSLQLAEQERLDGPMRILLDHLHLLAAHDMKGLSVLCDVNDTYLRDMVAEVRALNPRPAGSFDTLHVQTIVPDVLMKRLPSNLGGGWRVELNAETLPRVLLNESYYTEVAGRASARKDKDYLNQQLQNANWLIRALDQRAKTILKVAGELVEKQDGFFLYGVEFLRPMTLRDIAEKIDMHESTVSRVTSNKYIGTPRGIFELKWFFTTGLGEGDSAHSAESVRARIKALIEAEDPRKVLSDDSLVDLLTAEKIDIARRTVAKYRESLKIPSSVERRRQKKSR